MCKASASYRVMFAVVLLGVFGGAALAAAPVFWEISKQEEVVKGDASGVSIAENGAITLAPTYSLVYDTKEAYIWSSAADAAGNIYLGTGHEGRIFKIDASGAGRLLYDAPELDVSALATDPQGNLYAGTSPDGKIYKIAPDAKASVFYDPPDKYIWSLAFDAAASTLYVGTGDKGVIYKIDSSGKASALIDTNETNIVSLALDNSGNLLAGTDPAGLVLRIAASGKAFAVFDSPLQEIHSLTVARDGAVYALGVNPQGATQRSSGIGTSTTTTLSSDAVITISSSDEDQVGQSSIQTVDLSGLLNQSKPRSRNSAEGARSAVFRILPDGGNEVVWSSNDTTGFALNALSDGRVLVGTGNKGRIYQIGSDRSSTLLVQSPEDQTSTIISINDSLLATSSNLGRLYRIGRQSVGEGKYVSPIHDTKFAGHWGVITWRGSGNVELQTRSGNTESPDATWSDWSESYRNASGDQITSPHARFIQWRAILRSAAQSAAPAAARRAGSNGQMQASEKSGSAAQLQSVVIAYLPRNRAPEISSVIVLPPGVALQEMPIMVDPSISSSGLDPQLFGVATSVPPRRYFQKGARTITWQASDPNDDTLTFTLTYRTLNDSEWHVLADGFSQAYYTIDGNRLPDGSYIFKVRASDSPSNPATLALTSEDVSDAVQIDNTPPEISVSGPVANAQTIEVTFDAKDATSRVVRGEYSIDGGAWQLVFPVDGIADSAHESFKVKAMFDKAGEHIIAFRCADSSANVGTGKITVVAR